MHASSCSPVSMHMLTPAPILSQEVFLHPFAFAEGHQMADSSRKARCRLLEQLACHREGLWRRECSCGGPNAAQWGEWAPNLQPPDSTLWLSEARPPQSLFSGIPLPLQLAAATVCSVPC